MQGLIWCKYVELIRKQLYVRIGLAISFHKMCNVGYDEVL